MAELDTLRASLCATTGERPKKPPPRRATPVKADARGAEAQVSVTTAAVRSILTAESTSPHSREINRGCLARCRVGDDGRARAVARVRCEKVPTPDRPFRVEVTAITAFKRTHFRDGYGRV